MIRRAATTVSGRLWILPIVAASVFGIWSFARPADAAVVAAQDTDQSFAELGAELYATQCASCHGVEGYGIVDRGPPLINEGEASADFVLRTGRMPLAAPDLAAKRGPVRYSNREIEALVAHVGSFGDGPAIPDVDPEAGDVAEGGIQYRLNCAACHVASGAGASIGGAGEAPTLMLSTPTEIGQAILIGPGLMPRFTSLDGDDINDIAAYIAVLQDENTAGPSKFGGVGPVSEGLAAWLLALLPLVALTRWIGSPHEGRDEHAHPDGEPT